MNVFLSWSGDRSHKVAQLLGDWVCCVIQATKPWISSRDLDRGALWLGEINNQLKETTVGIICLTQENKNRPWILFEAGALAKGLAGSRVCTFLIDLSSTDLKDPLAQFNHTFPKKDSVHALVKTLNASLPSGALDPRILDQVFETYWPQFESRFHSIIENTTDAPQEVPRNNEDVLSEILDITRNLSHRLNRIERDLETDEYSRGNLQLARMMEAFNKPVGEISDENIRDMNNWLNSKSTESTGIFRRRKPSGNPGDF